MWSLMLQAPGCQSHDRLINQSIQQSIDQSIKVINQRELIHSMFEETRSPLPQMWALGQDLPSEVI